MSQPNERERWKQDEAVLARIGAVVFTQNTEVEIRLSRTLADEAVSAWQRDDEPEGQLSRETVEEGLIRRRASTLALIGCALEERGRLDGDEVIVRLDAWLVGDALSTADDAGALEQ